MKFIFLMYSLFYTFVSKLSIMKYSFLIVVIFIGIISNTFSQEKKLEKLVSLGISRPILSNGTGFHAGFNPSFKLTKRISLEGQLSYIYTEIESYFLSNSSGTINDINFLAGARFYLNSSENKNRLFINFLLGLNYNNDQKSGEEKREEFGTGFSVGAYYSLNKLNFGLSYDTHQIVLKFGYSF